VGAVMKIGIVGHGIVGKSVEHVFKDGSAKLYIYDPKYRGHDVASLEYISKFTDFIFVCVPTPMQGVDGGSIDTSIIESVLDEIYENIGRKQISKAPIIVIKSTVVPSKLKEYQEKYSGMRLVMSPEFLTERNYLEDAANMKFLIVGGQRVDCDCLYQLYVYYSICNNYHYKAVDIVTAGVVKYAINSFLATKVIFMNQLHDYCTNILGLDDWESFQEAFRLDSRCGNSHDDVPGPDGDFGFGGKCFPKDINALDYDAQCAGDDVCVMSLIQHVWEVNQNIRSNRDWEDIEGAVTL
jgi:nucleotide sugar dehydrogenase